VSIRKIFFVICLILSVFCLATGYGSARQWMGAIVAILMGPAWYLARNYPDSPLPFLCLSGSVGLAVVGRLIGSSPLWMIFGSAAALVVWDLIFLDSALGKHSSTERTRQYENKHLQALLLALGSALFATVFGRLVNIQIPFIVLILFLAFLLFALDRVWGYIKKTGRL
jgi:hypothetical protein